MNIALLFLDVQQREVGISARKHVNRALLIVLKRMACETTNELGSAQKIRASCQRFDYDNKAS